MELCQEEVRSLAQRLIGCRLAPLFGLVFTICVDVLRFYAFIAHTDMINGVCWRSSKPDSRSDFIGQVLVPVMNTRFGKRCADSGNHELRNAGSSSQIHLLFTALHHSVGARNSVLSEQTKDLRVTNERRPAVDILRY